MKSIITLSTLLLFSICALLNAVNGAEEVHITITNESPQNLEVGWFNPTTNEIENNSRWELSGGSALPMTSFAGHRFGVLSNERLIGTIMIKDQMVQHFVVNENMRITERGIGTKMKYVSPWELDGVTNVVKVLVVNDYGDDINLSIFDENVDKEGKLASGEHLFIDHSMEQSISLKSKDEKVVIKLGESAQQAILVTNISGVMAAKHVDVLSHRHKLSKEEYSMIKKAELRQILTQCREPGVDSGDCIRELTASYFLEHSRNLQKINTMRGFISDSWENYTCADPNLPTSPALENTTFHYHNNTYDAQVLHTRPSSQVHFLSDFITEEECEAVEKAAENHLHKAATEGDEAGKESKVRKAMQAGVNVPYSNHSHPISRLGRKVIAYANHATNFTLGPDGQEPLMSIQYKGNGPNDPFPDQYMPHCDGSCDGTPHQLTGRVATMVLYCKVPELGGATNFKNAGLHVVPKRYSAVYFSYVNLDDNLMDSGFTTHSGCPVIHGRKILVTQWLRKGVSKEKPYTKYSADGNKYANSQLESDHCENPFYNDFDDDDLLPFHDKHICPN